MRPLAGLSFGGTSPPPLKVAWMGILRAKACEPPTSNATQARARRPRGSRVLPFRNQRAVADIFSPVRRLISRGCGASERQPRIGEDGIVARRVMRVAEK